MQKVWRNKWQYKHSEPFFGDAFETKEKARLASLGHPPAVKHLGIFEMDCDHDPTHSQS